MNEVINSKRLNSFKYLFLIVLTAAALPLFNLICLIMGPADNDFFVMLICLFFIFVVSPVLFLITVLSPKKWFLGDEKTVFTILLSFVFWVILFFMVGIIKEFQEKKFLNSFEPAINYIDNYKNVHKKYPDNISAANINSEKAPYQKFYVFDEADDYILELGQSSNPSLVYIYCSNVRSENCSSRVSLFSSSSTVGKWIRAEIND